MRTKLTKRVTAWFLSAITTIVTFATGVMPTFAVEAPDMVHTDDPPYDITTQVNYNQTVWCDEDISTSLFYAKDSDGNLFTAICADPLKRTPLGDYDYEIIDGTLKKYESTNLMTKVFYFGLEDTSASNPFAVINGSFDAETNNAYRILLTHSALSAVLHGVDNVSEWNEGIYYEGGEVYTTILNDDGIGWVRALLNYADAHTIPDNCWSAALAPSKGMEDRGGHPREEYQTLVVFGQYDVGYAEIQKVSANPTMTANNDNYSLADAEFTFYSNSTCLDKFAKFTVKTDEDGYVKTHALKAGETYYVRETKAPKGFNKNYQLGTVTIQKNGTARVTWDGATTIADKPVNDPVSIILNKKSANTDAVVATNASLQGTVYKAEVYDKNPDTDATATKLKTWYAATNIGGMVRFNIESYYNAATSLGYSSDSFYEVKDGRITIPYGFLVITEVKAPNGFKVDNTYRWVVDTAKSAHEIGVDANYVDEKDHSEEPIIVTLQKSSTGVTSYDATQGKLDLNSLVGGAEYGFYTTEALAQARGTDGQIAKVTTDGNGEAAVNIAAGTYYVIELNAPNNYLRSDEVTKITVASSEDVEVFDKPASGSLTIYKKGETLDSHAQNGYVEGTVGSSQLNYTDSKLAGFEFEVTAKTDTFIGQKRQYKAGDVVAAKVVTDANGEAKLSGLGFGTYTVKEVKAQGGYVGDLDVNAQIQSHDVTISYQDQNTEVVFKDVTITNQRQKISVKITKKDAETNVNLSGAQYTLYANENIKNNAGTVIVPKDTALETVETNADGVANFTLDLPLAQYYIKETKAPSYVLSNNIKVSYTISNEKYSFTFAALPQTQSSTTVEHTFYNTAEKGTAEIVKKDETTNALIKSTSAYNGAVYGLYAREAILSPDNSGTVKYAAGTKIAEVKLDGNSYGKVENLYFGKYYWKEITSPVGYVLNNTEYDFTLDSTKQSATVEAIDKEVTGSIDISKKGNVLKSYNGTNFIYVSEYLAGAKVEVRVAEDIYTPDGQGTYAKYNGKELKAGTVVTTVTTTKTGATRVSGLPLGKYTLVEVEAPAGYYGDYVNSALATHDITLSYANQNTSEVLQSLQLTNDLQKMSLDVTKTDAESTVALPGAQFTLYAGQDILNVDGLKIVDKDTALQTVTTNADGKANFTVDLPFAKYYVKETKAPTHTLSNGIKVSYALDPQTKNFEFTPLSQDKTSTSFSYSFTDAPNKGSADIYKLDSTTGAPVKGTTFNGAVYGLYAKEAILAPDGSGTVKYAADAKITEVKLDGNSYAKVDNLYFGKYYWQEITAPTGYVIDTTKYDFTLTADNVTVTTNAQDKPTVGSLNIYKKGEVLTGFVNGQFVYEDAYIGGAIIEVRAKEDIYTPDGQGTYAKYNGVDLKAGTLVATVTTVNGGPVTVENLPLGTYTVTEIQAPAGYVIETEPALITLAYATQNDVVVSSESVIYNERQTVEISLIKMSDDTKTVLPNATYGLYVNEDIYDNDGKLVIIKDSLVAQATTDENGKATFDIDLPIGVYYTKEIEPPIGFEKSEEKQEINFTEPGKDKENVVIEATDAPSVIIGTTATVDDGKSKEVEADKEIILIDTVAFSKLVIGKEYTVTGVLMNKDTGKELLDENGKTITSTKTFVAETTDGTVEVEFKFNSKIIENTSSIVVFEDLYQNGIKISTHSDITDKGQTVEIVRTGDNTNIATLTLTMLLAAFVGVLALTKKKKEA